MAYNQTEYFRNRYQTDPGFRERRIAAAKAWTQRMLSDPAARREYLRRRLCKTYGLTPEELDEVELVCRICGLEEDYGLVSSAGRPMARLHMDHNHKTRKARKFLCGPCNKGLGHFRDDPELLERAAEYLREEDDGQAPD